MTEQIPETPLASALLTLGVVSTVAGGWVRNLLKNNKGKDATIADRDEKIEELKDKLDAEITAHQNTRNLLLIATTNSNTYKESIEKLEEAVRFKQERIEAMTGNITDIIKRLGSLENDHDKQSNLIKEIQGELKTVRQENAKLITERAQLIIERDEARQQRDEAIAISQRLQKEINQLNMVISNNKDLIEKLQKQMNELSFQNENSNPSTE